MPEIGFETRHQQHLQHEARLTDLELKRSRILSCIYSGTDLIAAIPLDILAFACGFANPYQYRLIKLAKIVRVNEQFMAISVALERRKLVVNAGIHRMIYLWGIFTLSGHWFACGFFSIGRRVFANREIHSWIKNDNLVAFEGDSDSMKVKDGVSVLHLYVRSVYWAITTMVTVGFGDIVPAASSDMETMFALATMYVGMTLSCLIIGNLTNMVANLDHAEDAFHNRIDNLNKYMAYRHLSPDLRDRIRAYYTYMWTSLKGVNEDEFLNQLPIALRLEVTGLRSKDLVKQVPFLRKAREALVNALCVELEQVIVSPGDFLVRKGQAIHGCYWFRRGDAEQVSPDDVTVQQPLSGKQRSFFGDASLFFPCVCENSIRARSYCEFFFLKRQTFTSIINDACSKEEARELKEAADKARKRDAKIKKFFGISTTISAQQYGWKALLEQNSKFREMWNLIGTLGVLYNATLIPYRLAMQTLVYKELITPNQFIWDWSFDFLFIMDVIFRAFFFPLVKEGIIIRDRSQIFSHYRTNTNWVRDLCIACPLDILGFVLDEDQTFALVRFPKLLRLGYLVRHYDIAKYHLANRGITFTNAIHRMTKMFVWVILFTHIVGCGWISMAKLSYYYANEISLNLTDGYTTVSYGLDPYHPCMTVEMNWICLDNMTWSTINHEEAHVTYLRAIYFVLLDMTTVGYADIVPKNTRETLYVTFLTLFGGLGYPAVVSAMAAMIGNLNLARAEFRAKLGIVNQFSLTKSFPKRMKVRMAKYFDYIWSRQRGVDEDRILNDLPPGLRMEVQEYINGSIMRNIPFFAKIDSELLRHLLSVLQPSVYLPNDEIISADEMGQEMFLLERGATRVTSKDGKLTYAILTPGDYFGEACLVAATKRTANVIAIGYCDCFTLHRDDFDRVTNHFPEQREQVITDLRATVDEKNRKNVAVVGNMKAHHKLKSLTSYDYTHQRSISESSWRHPDSFKRRIWDLGLLAVTLSNVLFIPFRISFTMDSLFFYVVDCIMDLMLIADVVFHFRYFGYVCEATVFSDREDIKRNYWKSKRFVVDLLTCFPFEIIGIVGTFTGMEAGTASTLTSLLRLPKLLLLFRIDPWIRNLDTLFGSSMLRNHDAAFRLFKLLIVVVCISHWTGCVFYAVANFVTGNGFSEEYCGQVGDSKNSSDLAVTWPDSCPRLEYLYMPGLSVEELSCGMTYQAACNWNNTWIGHQIKLGLLPQNGGTLTHRYLRAITWALPTLVAVVIGDVVPVTTWGTLYVTMGIIAGVTINAAIIGNIASLVANLEGVSASYRQRMDQFERFFHLYRLPKDLQQRTRNYLEFIWDTQKGLSEDQMIHQMPATLRSEMSNFLKLKFIKAAPFFEVYNVALQKGIANKLSQRVYSPTDFIVYEGDLGTEMFFLEQGLIQVVTFRGNWRSLEHRNSVLGQGGSMSSIGSSRAGSSSMGPRRHLFTRSHNSRQSSAVHVMGQAGRPTRRTSSTTRKGSLHPENCHIEENQVIVLGQLESGAFFGETALFFNERRTTSVRALDFSQCYALHKDDLNEVLTKYPHEFDEMYDIICRLRQNNLMRNENVKANMERISCQGTNHRLKIIGEIDENVGVGSVVFSRITENNGSILRFSQEIVKRGSMLLGLKEISSKVLPSNAAIEMDSEPIIDGVEGGSDLRKPSITMHQEKEAKRGRISDSSHKCYKPSDPFFICWNGVALLFTLVHLFTTPYRLAFFGNGLYPFHDRHRFLPTSWLVWVPAEYCIDAFFMVDVYMRSTRFAINQFGKIIQSKNGIFEHYKSTWLVYDVIAVIPFDLIVVIYGIIVGTFPVTEFAFVRLTRLFRLTRLRYYVRVNDRFLSDLFPRLNSAVSETVKLFFLMFMLNHWLACTWFMVHRFLETDVHNTWAISDGLATYIVEEGRHNVFNSDLTPSFCYLRALYFTVSTMSSVGYGDIRAYTVLETIHELVDVLIGACTLAALIGAVAVTYSHMDTSGERNFKSKTRKLIEYMNFQELPHEAQENIIRYFTETWERFEGVELSETISVLPLPLQLELSIWVHRDIINKVRGLRRCHFLVQRHISRRLGCLLVRAGHHVYRQGDIGRKIYFILNGQLLLTDAAGQEKKLKGGHHFGGDTLYSVTGERKESVVCLDDAELYHICKEDFEEIAREFTDHHNVGIFGELFKPEGKTVIQKRALSQQLEEITNKTKTPLTRFASRHIEDILKAKDIIEGMSFGSPTTANLKYSTGGVLLRNTMKGGLMDQRSGCAVFEDIEDALSTNTIRRQEYGLEFGGVQLVRQLSETQIQRELSLRHLPF